MFPWGAETNPRATGEPPWLALGLRACALVSAGVMLSIVVFVGLEAWPAVARIGLDRLFGDPSWHPAAGVAAGGTFGVLPMVAGTLGVAFGALVVATPLALLSAAFCQFRAPPRLARAYRRLIELLAGIPSVVYGFWGLVVLVPLVRRLAPPGPSLLAGILVLTLMILPTIALGADAAFRAVPRSQHLAAAALGLSRFSTLTRVVVPASRSGLTTAVLLGLGRAVGETMAVLMVCGNVVQVPDSLFDPVRTLTANIALEMAYALGDHRAALYATGMVSLLLVAALVLLAEGLGGSASNGSASNGSASNGSASNGSGPLQSEPVP